MTPLEQRAEQSVDIRERIMHSLNQVIDPEIRKPITQLDMVESVEVDDGGTATVRIRLTITACPAAERIERDVTQAVLGTDGVVSALIEVGAMSPAQRSALSEKLRGAAERENPFGPGTSTRVIAVASGKGGVGKSTVTANLAVALAAAGHEVGILDADVHGFSIPGLLGLVSDGAAQKPTRVDDMILPPVAYGVKVISIGMFLDGPSAVSWRGPMLHRTINQFLTDVFFADIDVLLLDLPPGTGDIAISIGQLLPNAEVIVVTTPQPAAVDVAERSAILARQTGQTVIGVVENMAGYTTSDGTRVDLFGSGGGDLLAHRLSHSSAEDVPLLASVPVSVGLREGGDSGRPVVVSDPMDAASQALDQLAQRIVAGVWPQRQND